MLQSNFSIETCFLQDVKEDRSYLALERYLKARDIHLVAGVDEAGRGPLAGPVVAAAAILPQFERYSILKDSKTIKENKREEIYEFLINLPGFVYAISVVDHDTIEEINIRRATLYAMKEAVLKLSTRPDFVLIDGRDGIKELDIAHQPIIKGDSLSQSIAAASIIAKVERDRLMRTYDARYPEWGFKKHKGYGTKAHREAIMQYGLSPIHRKTFCH